MSTHNHCRKNGTRQERKYLTKQLLKTVLESIRLLLQEVIALLGTDEAGLHAGKRPVCMSVKRGRRRGGQREEDIAREKKLTYRGMMQR